MTPFMELAIRIGDDLRAEWFCCNELVEHIPSSLVQAKRKKLAVEFLKKHFRPCSYEQTLYKVSSNVWLSQDATDHLTYEENKIFDNEFRIMVLLFADLMWKESQE